MRVLMTTDAVGGVWTHALELARALRTREVEVVLAVLGEPPGPAQRAAARELPHVRLHTCPGKLEWMDRPWDDVERAGAWLLALARRARPDVVHLNDFSHGARPFGAPVLVVGHSCCLSWWEAVHGTPPPPTWAAYRARVRGGLRGADMVAAPTRFLLDELRRLYGPLGRARVIGNGILMPARAGVDREPFILGAGRLWDEAKNAAVLARAAAGLPWPVVLAGEDRDPDGGRRRMEGVRCAGRLSAGELARLQSRASIFAHPALYEPFGLAPLEAAARGCALVLGDIPGLREVWGDAALWVDPRDGRALHAALRRLIDDPDLLRERARRARARARLHTVTRMAAAYASAYRSLARGAGASVSTLQRNRS